MQERQPNEGNFDDISRLDHSPDGRYKKSLQQYDRVLRLVIDIITPEFLAHPFQFRQGFSGKSKELDEVWGFHQNSPRRFFVFTKQPKFGKDTLPLFCFLKDPVNCVRGFVAYMGICNIADHGRRDRLPTVFPPEGDSVHNCNGLDEFLGNVIFSNESLLQEVEKYSIKSVNEIIKERQKKVEEAINLVVAKKAEPDSLLKMELKLGSSIECKLSQHSSRESFGSFVTCKWRKMLCDIQDCKDKCIQEMGAMSWIQADVKYIKQKFRINITDITLQRFIKEIGEESFDWFCGFELWKDKKEKVQSQRERQSGLNEMRRLTTITEEEEPKEKSEEEELEEKEKEREEERKRGREREIIAKMDISGLVGEFRNIFHKIVGQILNSSGNTQADEKRGQAKKAYEMLYRMQSILKEVTEKVVGEDIKLHELQDFLTIVNEKKICKLEEEKKEMLKDELTKLQHERISQETLELKNSVELMGESLFELENIIEDQETELQSLCERFNEKREKVIKRYQNKLDALKLKSEELGQDSELTTERDLEKDLFKHQQEELSLLKEEIAERRAIIQQMRLSLFKQGTLTKDVDEGILKDLWRLNVETECREAEIYQKTAKGVLTQEELLKEMRRLKLRQLSREEEKGKLGILTRNARELSEILFNVIDDNFTSEDLFKSTEMPEYASCLKYRQKLDEICSDPLQNTVLQELQMKRVNLEKKSEDLVAEFTCTESAERSKQELENLAHNVGDLDVESENIGQDEANPSVGRSNEQEGGWSGEDEGKKRLNDCFTELRELMHRIKREEMLCELSIFTDGKSSARAKTNSEIKSLAKIYWDAKKESEPFDSEHDLCSLLEFIVDDDVEALKKTFGEDETLLFYQELNKSIEDIMHAFVREQQDHLQMSIESRLEYINDHQKEPKTFVRPKDMKKLEHKVQESTIGKELSAQEKVVSCRKLIVSFSEAIERLREDLRADLRNRGISLENGVKETVREARECLFPNFRTLVLSNPDILRRISCEIPSKRKMSSEIQQIFAFLISGEDSGIGFFDRYVRTTTLFLKNEAGDSIMKKFYKRIREIECGVKMNLPANLYSFVREAGGEEELLAPYLTGQCELDEAVHSKVRNYFLRFIEKQYRNPLKELEVSPDSVVDFLSHRKSQYRELVFHKGLEHEKVVGLRDLSKELQLGHEEPELQQSKDLEVEDGSSAKNVVGLNSSRRDLRPNIERTRFLVEQFQERNKQKTELQRKKEKEKDVGVTV